MLGNKPGAFERLVRQYQGLCWHIVQRMVRHPEDTRELCQEAFLRVHRNLHQYRFDAPLKSWIGQVAYSIARRHLERKRIALVEASDEETPLHELVGDGFDLEAACADHELTGLLGQAIERLPAIQRTLVTLYHLDDLPVGEIAVITGLPEGTVKSYLFRARAKLREVLEPNIGVAA